MRLALCWLLVCTGACGNPSADRPSGDEGSTDSKAAPQATDITIGEGDANLLLVWYDEQATPHTETDVGAVPEEQREQVRVSFASAESPQPPAGKLFVADLTKAGAGDRYPLRAVSRKRFDAMLASRVQPPPSAAPAGEDAEVVLYGTSWCGACKKARRFLRERGVPFADHDIEKEPQARAEMKRKARAQGVRLGGVPVIDVNGTLMPGFDPNRLMQLLNDRG